MLSFQVADTGRTVKVFCDAKGMAILLSALAKLVGERASHVHLRTPGEGGNDLNEKTPWGEEAALEVMIQYQEHE